MRALAAERGLLNRYMYFPLPSSPFPSSSPFPPSSPFLFLPPSPPLPSTHPNFLDELPQQQVGDDIILTYTRMLPYASFDEPVFEGYGDTKIARLQRVRAVYDPSFVFQRLVTGGHKVPLT